MRYLYQRTDFCYSTDNNQTKTHISTKKLIDEMVRSTFPRDKYLYLKVIQMYGWAICLGLGVCVLFE